MGVVGWEESNAKPISAIVLSLSPAIYADPWRMRRRNVSIRGYHPRMDARIILYAQVGAPALRAVRPTVMAEAATAEHTVDIASIGQLLRARQRVLQGVRGPGGLVAVIPDCLKGVKTLVAGM